jgi:hypothetical protein
MSVLINESHASSTTPCWAVTLPFGKFPVVASTQQIISIPGMTATGMVMVNYLHTNTSGGAGQFISNITPQTDSVKIILGQTGATSPNQEYILWQVISLS